MCETPSLLHTELYEVADKFIPGSPPPYDGFDTTQFILDDAFNTSPPDHHEVVDSAITWPKEMVNGECDPGLLFSFELETSDIPQLVLDTVDDLLTDFGYTEGMGDTSDPCNSRQSFLESNVPCSTQTTISPPNSSIFYPGVGHNKGTINKKDSSRSFGDLRVNHCGAVCSYSPDAAREYLDSYSEESSTNASTSHGFLNNEDLARGTPGARLTLTLEERKMLKAMGVTPPTRFPLTRSEEKALKTVRRKIRNKLSAQASRMRHQEYVAQLERRVERRDEENIQLRRHIVSLEKDKRDLLFHVKKLRAYISKLLTRDKHTTPLPMFVPLKQSGKHFRSSAQTATAAAGGTSLLLMTFLFLTWTAMVPTPSQHARISNSAVADTRLSTHFMNLFPGRSRTLLETKVSNDEFTQDTTIPTHSDRPAIIPVGTVSPRNDKSAKTSKSRDNTGIEEITGLNNTLSVVPLHVGADPPSGPSPTIGVHGVLTSVGL